MLLVRKLDFLLSEILKYKSLGRKINFIPTMGSLHQGHISLIKKAKKGKQICIVSIFVNPLQFNDPLDFKNYPRSKKIDRSLLMKEDVDLLFVPDKNFISGDNLPYSLGDISKILCGKDRHGHFEGVAKVIIKFLSLINPDFIYLGEKDFQQTVVIKKIIKDFNFKAKVKVISTVRDENRVALSSRNKLLKKNKYLACLIPRTLAKIIEEIENGDFKLSRINEFKKIIKKKGIDKVNYLEIRKESDLQKLGPEFCVCRVFISVSICNVRLIDNMRVKKKIKLNKEKKLEISS